MKFQREDLIAPSMLFAFFASVYVLFPTRLFVFEGLGRAMPIDLGDFPRLFNGNYLFYGPLGAVYHAFLGAMGVEQLALYSLQMMDGVLGATAVATFYFIVRALDGERLQAAAWAAALGSTLGFMIWSTDAQTYILSALLIEANFLALIFYVKHGRGRPEILALLHVLALGAHFINALFGLAILAALYQRHGKKDLWPYLRYLATLAGATLLLYAVALWIVRPESLRDAWIWFLGSTSRDEDAGMRLRGGPSLWKLGLWLKMSVNIFLPFGPGFPQEIGGSVVMVWVGRVLLLAGGVFAWRRREQVWKRDRALIAVCLAWLAPYAAFFMSWEPWMMMYRITDLPALLTLGFFALRGVSARWPALLAATMFCANFGSEIFPRTFRDNNPDLIRMDRLREHTREGDWVAGDGGMDEFYIPYFAARRPLVIGRYHRDHATLRRILNGMLKDGERVFITRKVATMGGWGKFFAAYPKKKVVDEKRFALWLLLPPSSS